MRHSWHSLQFRIPIVIGVSFLLLLGAVMAVVSTLGRNLLEQQAYREVVQSGENIVAGLASRVALAESLAAALANLGEVLPTDEAATRRAARHLLDYEGTEGLIAGGGLWPEPFSFDPLSERRSFFWGRDTLGQLRFLDDYNDPEGPGYHNEEWYVPAKYVPEGRAFWSRSYVDPYSHEPMVTVTVPMYRDGRFYGVSTVDLKLTGLQELLASTTRAFGGYAFALDRNGKFLSFPNEQLIEIYETDQQGRRTKAFIEANTLARTLPGFDQIAAAIETLIEHGVRDASRSSAFDPTLASRIANDVHQLQEREARVMAALLGTQRSDALATTGEPTQLFIEKDPILGEASFAALFDMPDTGWKIAAVMPYSKAIAGAQIIYEKLITAVVAVALGCFALILLFVRRTLVWPITGLSGQLRAMTDGRSPEQLLLNTDERGELRELVERFNERTRQLLGVQAELRDARSRLEQRVAERTRELQREVDHRRAQEIEREIAQARVERQHAAIVALSLQQDLLGEDVRGAARRFTETAAAAVEAERVSIWLIDDAQECLVAVDVYVRSEQSHYADIKLSLKDHPSYFGALQSDRSIAVTDILADSRTAEMRDYARTFGIRSLLDSPFRIGGRLHGVVCFEHLGDVRRWYPDEIRFAGELADQFIHVLAHVERKQSDEKIRQLAFYDPLTDLANRRLLDETILHSLELARRQRCVGSLIYLDLDNFKTLNDSLGHAVGDELLAQLGRRLTMALRREDMAARLGGDEFVVLLPAEAHDRNEAMRQVLVVANKVKQVVSQPYHLGRHEHIITASIGITLYPDQQDAPVDVLKQADAAMYRAKADGRNRIAFYDPSMQEAAKRRLLIEKDLRQAVRNGQFEVHYQPQIGRHGRAIGAEALVRWHHPERGLIGPVEFIDIAEETGLILDLGLSIMTKACRFIGESELAQVAVNISPLQFRHPDFVTQVTDILERTDTPPERLMIEITESIVIGDVDDTVQKMKQLKDKGIRFAIDDFGTGYSSLSYLKRLPLDQLKINNDFVRDIETDANDALLVTTIISMAQLLGLDVVAEGVENAAQLEFLTYRGCHLFQGFYFSHPLTEHALIDYLAGQRGTSVAAGQ